MNSIYRKLFSWTVLTIVAISPLAISSTVQAADGQGRGSMPYSQGNRGDWRGNRGWSGQGNGDNWGGNAYYNTNPYYYSDDNYYYNANPNPYPSNYNYDKNYNPSANPYWFGDTPY